MEQAYVLNQSLRNVVLGGTLWLKMGKKRIGTAIDLSALGLNTIEEDAEHFYIGTLCSLRELELHEDLNRYFNGILAKAVQNIVGVQFRNCATVGGSVFARFGFSDVLTALLALDTEVLLHQGGQVKLADFVKMPRDRDILVKVLIKKDARKASYSSLRKSAADLPVLNCAISHYNGAWNIVMGSRPQKAMLTVLPGSENPTEQEVEALYAQVLQQVPFGTNYRGTEAYRRILAAAMMKRNIQEICEGGHYANTIVD